MMVLMKHTFQKQMWLIPFTNVKEHRPVPSRLRAFQRMQDLPEYVLVIL